MNELGFRAIVTMLVKLGHDVVLQTNFHASLMVAGQALREVGVRPQRGPDKVSPDGSTTNTIVRIQKRDRTVPRRAVARVPVEEVHRRGARRRDTARQRAQVRALPLAPAHAGGWRISGVRMTADWAAGNHAIINLPARSPE